MINILSSVNIFLFVLAVRLVLESEIEIATKAELSRNDSGRINVIDIISYALIIFVQACGFFVQGRLK